MTSEEAEKLVDQAAEALGEHFEAVIIICSRPAPSNERLTAIIRKGRGNWFAQNGMLRAIVQSDEHTDLALEMIRCQNEAKKEEGE